MSCLLMARSEEEEGPQTSLTFRGIQICFDVDGRNCFCVDKERKCEKERGTNYSVICVVCVRYVAVVVRSLSVPVPQSKSRSR